MKGAKPFGDLCHQVAHGIQTSAGVVNHPLRQCLPFHEFHRHIHMLAGAAAGVRTQDIGAVNTPRDPLLQQKTVQMIRIATQLRRRRFQHQLLPREVVGGQIHMAACARMQLAHDRVTLKHHAWRQRGWQRQAFAQHMQVVRLCIRQCINAHQLHRHVVIGAARQHRIDQCLGSPVKIVWELLQRFMYRSGIEMGVGTVGRQHIQGAHLG